MLSHVVYKMIGQLDLFVEISLFSWIVILGVVFSVFVVVVFVAAFVDVHEIDVVRVLNGSLVVSEVHTVMAFG